MNKPASSSLDKSLVLVIHTTGNQQVSEKIPLIHLVLIELLFHLRRAQGWVILATISSAWLLYKGIAINDQT
jgi:hypothetical protein